MVANKVDGAKQDRSVIWSIVRILIITAVILLIPLIAMQFTSEVKWTVSDFVVIGALLIGTGLVYEIVSRQLKSKKQRIVFAVVLLIVFVLIWVDMAVGIFGTPISGS